MAMTLPPPAIVILNAASQPLAETIAAAATAKATTTSATAEAATTMTATWAVMTTVLGQQC